MMFYRQNLEWLYGYGKQKTWNKWIFPFVLILPKFCHVLCYMCLLFSCVFECTNNTTSLSLPHKDGFSKFSNSYIKSAYYIIFYDYSIDPDETWMNGNWFYTKLWRFWGLYQTTLHDDSNIEC